jgi:2-polyprenyl-3-methyl-5-hydroxy-6-metoxy-1,4-benzoquinol methylase
MNLQDKSNGYDEIAQHFIAARNSRIGPRLVREWSAALRPGTAILDLACGHGVPTTQTLIDQGFEIYGIDASPRLLAEFRKNFPAAYAECAAVEDSEFFGRSFYAVICWGLMFLLPLETQRLVISKVARALNPDGKFLFTSVKDEARWNDSLTGRDSYSPGVEWYRRALREEGLAIEREESDEGENYNFFVVKPA